VQAPCYSWPVSPRLFPEQTANPVEYRAPAHGTKALVRQLLASPPGETLMSLKKQYFKTKPFCKITFSVPKQLAACANTVHLVGDFNDWNRSITPMKRRKNGTFTATVYLRPDCDYQFRYLLDGITWENDPQAEKYAPNVYGSENSVVAV
jgi:hypothetical protein